MIRKACSKGVICLFFLPLLLTICTADHAPTSSPDSGDLEFTEALIIGAVVLALLTILVVLRFTLNIVLDVCILDEFDNSVRRTLAEWWRKICPCWHRRTQPEGTTVDRDDGTARGSRNGRIQATVEHQKQALHGYLPDRILSAETIEGKKMRHCDENLAIPSGCHDGDHNDDVLSHGAAVQCPICLHEMHEGEIVFSGKCDHLFHKDCIIEWLSKNGSDCPYCRMELLPQDVLARIRRGDHPTLHR